MKKRLFLQKNSDAPMKHIPLQIGFRKVFRLPGSRAAFKTERKLSFLQFFH